jgi:hypothetical protein
MIHICRQIKDILLLIGRFSSENRRNRLPLRIADDLGFYHEETAEIEDAIATGPRPTISLRTLRSKERPEHKVRNSQNFQFPKQ